MPFFFFRELQLITVLLLICDSYMSWSTSFVSLNLWVGLSIFDSLSFVFIKAYIFVQKTAWTLWLQNIIDTFKIKIIEKRHTVFFADLWFLTCSKTFKLLWYLREFEFPKNWSGNKFLNLKIEVLRTSVFLNSNFSVNMLRSFT